MSEPRRRVPVQARSRRRYEAILDSAANLFAESGFEGATMEAIAAGAETSIGSVYTFFPDKLAILRALAERVLEREEIAFEQLSAGAHDRPWREVLDAVIDGIVALHRADPSFRAIWANLGMYGAYADIDEAVNARFRSRLESLLAAQAPDLKPKQRRLVAKMLLEVTSAVLFFAQRQRPFDQARVGELKRMLRAYLELYAPKR